MNSRRFSAAVASAMAGWVRRGAMVSLAATLLAATPADEPRGAGSKAAGDGNLAAHGTVASDRAAGAPGANAAGAQTNSGERWQSLFDGKSLSGWLRTEFEGDHEVKVDPTFRDGRGAIVLEPGTTLSGITWRDAATLPKMNYEVSLEAMRVMGGDFFCGLTFPVGSSACTFVVGGWGGTVVGISSIDHVDASGNETTREREFADGQWYRIRVRVTPGRLEAWIDDEPVVDFPTEGRRLGLRPGQIEKSRPLGVAAYQTRAALRDIRLRRW